MTEEDVRDFRTKLLHIIAQNERILSEWRQFKTSIVVVLAILLILRLVWR